MNISWVKKNKEKILSCPKCHFDMIKQTRNNVTIDKCEMCGGIWLDKGEMGKIIGKIDSGKGRGKRNKARR